MCVCCKSETCVFDTGYLNFVFMLQHLTGEELELITDFLRKRLSKVSITYII